MSCRLVVIPLLLCVLASCGEDRELSPEPTDSTYSVVITSLDPDWKIRAIKAVRQETGLGLADAKDLVENVPSIVKDGLTSVEAAALAKKLEESGMKVETREP